MFSSGFLSGSCWLVFFFFGLWSLFYALYGIFSVRVSSCSRPFFRVFVSSPVFSVGQLFVMLLMFFCCGLPSALYNVFLAWLKMPLSNTPPQVFRRAPVA